MTGFNSWTVHYCSFLRHGWQIPAYSLLVITEWYHLTLSRTGSEIISLQQIFNSCKKYISKNRQIGLLFVVITVDRRVREKYNDFGIITTFLLILLNDGSRVLKVIDQYLLLASKAWTILVHYITAEPRNHNYIYKRTLQTTIQKRRGLQIRINSRFLLMLQTIWTLSGINFPIWWWRLKRII